MVEHIIWLLLAYQAKHFIADYPLQSYPYAHFMLKKFSPERGEWIPALSAHAGVHAFGTIFIVMGFYILTTGMLVAENYTVILGAAAFDFVMHFTMDRIKASPNMLGRWKACSGPEFMDDMKALDGQRAYGEWGAAHKRQMNNSLFWWSLGIDQTVHHLTHYAIIFALVI